MTKVGTVLIAVFFFLIVPLNTVLSQPLNFAANAPTGGYVAYTGATVNFSTSNPAAFPRLLSGDKNYAFTFDVGDSRIFPDAVLYLRITPKLLFNLANSQSFASSSASAGKITGSSSQASEVTSLLWSAKQAWAAGFTYQVTPELSAGLAAKRVNYYTSAAIRIEQPAQSFLYPVARSFWSFDFGGIYKAKNWSIGAVLRDISVLKDENLPLRIPISGDGAIVDLGQFPGIAPSPKIKVDAGGQWLFWPQKNSSVFFDVSTLGELGAGVRHDLFSFISIMFGWASKYEFIARDKTMRLYSVALDVKVKKAVFTITLAQQYKQPERLVSSYGTEYIFRSSAVHRFGLSVSLFR